LLGVDHDPLARHLPGVPTPDRGDPEEALVADVLDPKPDLVHVGGQHQLRPTRAALLGDQVAHEIGLQVAEGGQLSLDDLTDQVLLARAAVGLGQLSEQINVHPEAFLPKRGGAALARCAGASKICMSRLGTSRRMPPLQVPSSSLLTWATWPRN